MTHRIGIDLGGTKIEIAVLDPAGGIALRRRADTPQDYPGIVSTITALVEGAERQLAVRATVGVGIPGVISPATGLVKNANSQALIGHALDQDLAAALNRPIRVDNDANCFALSEAADGAGAGRRLRVRRHPGHRLRRRDRRGRPGAARAQPHRGRVGPHPPAAAAGGRIPATPLLVRPAWVPGTLSRRPGPRRGWPSAGRRGAVRPRGGRGRRGTGGAGPPRRPAGARAGGDPERARPGRHRAGRRPVQHAASV